MGRLVWKVRVEGRERIPTDGPVIVAPTHESFLDPLVVGCYLPRGMRYMARRTLFVKIDDYGEKRRRFASWLGRWAGVIEVDREGAGREVLTKFGEALARGEAVLLFPEGTRSLDGNVQEFRSGVAILALKTGAPVMPVSVEGTRRIWGKGRKLPKFGSGPVRLVYGEPVRYQRPLKPEDVAADLRRRVLDLRGPGREDVARDGASSRGEAGGGSSK